MTLTSKVSIRIMLKTPGSPGQGAWEGPGKMQEELIGRRPLSGVLLCAGCL